MSEWSSQRITSLNSRQILSITNVWMNPRLKIVLISPYIKIAIRHRLRMPNPWRPARAMRTDEGSDRDTGRNSANPVLWDIWPIDSGGCALPPPEIMTDVLKTAHTLSTTCFWRVCELQEGLGRACEMSYLQERICSLFESSSDENQEWYTQQIILSPASWIGSTIMLVHRCQHQEATFRCPRSHIPLPGSRLWPNHGIQQSTATWFPPLDSTKGRVIWPSLWPCLSSAASPLLAFQIHTAVTSV